MADQFGSPTFTCDLASAIRGLGRLDARGILHVTNTGFCSWFEFAREILRQEGVTPFASYPSPRHRRAAQPSVPAYSLLSPGSLYVHVMKLRSWQEATGTYLEELARRASSFETAPRFQNREFLLRVPIRGPIN